MTERLTKIFDEIPRCKVFADIACDHGYIAEAMIKSGKCDIAYVSDISEKSLNKARELLKGYIAEKRAFGFVSDGFHGVPESDVALIAGVGGALTVRILKEAKSLPYKMVLQPMRNATEVRKTLLALGYAIIKDFTVFADGGFYDIIVTEKGKDFLNGEELEFGRDNVRERPAAFKAKMRVELGKLLSYAERDNVSARSKKQILKRAERYKAYV